MKPASEIILALDLDSLTKAENFVKELYPKIKIFKVGIHLFTLEGPKIVEFINKSGAEVFLDLKFFDIPNTVANAVRAATRMKVKMLTLHISGGADMLRQAQEAAKDEAGRLKIEKPLLIGVTVLTSKEANPTEILALAKMGLENGLDGVVCSAREAGILREEIKKDFAIITPGIRPDNAVNDDQKRTATVSEAVRAGSNFLVIGRPILKAESPLMAAEELLKQARSH
jgi:orotidine-5'-phosphate decarboxylase